jgi:hypothetical protein
MTHLSTSGLLALAAIAMTAAAGDPPPLKVTTKRADDRADVTTEKDKVVVSLRSPFGISQAAVERGGDQWPEAVVLRLHLKGLEHFKVTNGKVTLEGAVALRDGKPLVRLWKDGKEDSPLDAKSPYWIEVRAVGGDGKPAKELPLTGGYFELPLPKAVFEGNPKAVAASWIDFYRG